MPLHLVPDTGCNRCNKQSKMKRVLILLLTQARIKMTNHIFSVYLDEGSNPDVSGNLIAWLCRRKEVCAYVMDGHRYDIGDMAS